MRFATKGPQSLMLKAVNAAGLVQPDRLIFDCVRQRTDIEQLDRLISTRYSI